MGARRGLTASSIFWVYLLGMFFTMSVVRLSSPLRILMRSREYSFSCAEAREEGRKKAGHFSFKKLEGKTFTNTTSTD